MGTNRPYQSDYAKKAKTKDPFRQRKVMVLEKTISEDRKKRLIDWITFYRLNIHIFIYHYMGISLFPYQVIWVYLMNISDIFVTIASRACGKSWLVGVFAVAKAILWPGSEIVIVSATQKQAGLIVSEKIARLRDDYPNIAREIRDLTGNNNKWEVGFQNGSKIRVVAAAESGRGARSTFTIYDEFRLIDKEVVDAIVKPFGYSRQPPYIKNPKYKHLLEEPKEVYISSAYYKQHWWFETTKQVMKMMVNGVESANCLVFDWPVAVYHGIKTKKQLEKEKITMTTETYEQEYENIPAGSSGKSFFNLNMFAKSRTLKNSIYPQRADTYNARKNPYDSLKRVDGEIRLLSVDVAMRSGAKNDNTILTFFRLIPILGKGYMREVLYMESHNGMNSISQALRIKQLINDLDVDVLVMDMQNSGIALYDSLGLLTKDPERGIEYPALTVMDHPSINKETYEELAKRTLSIGASPIIYPISASAKLNSDIAVLFKDRLKKHMFSFLIGENEEEDVLMRKKDALEEIRDDSFIKAFYLNPFVQTSLFIGETLGLDVSLVSGNIKLSEKVGARKDRYTSVAYGNWYACLLDTDLLKENEGSDDWETLAGVTLIL